MQVKWPNQKIRYRAKKYYATITFEGDILINYQHKETKMFLSPLLKYYSIYPINDLMKRFAFVIRRKETVQALGKYYE